MKNRTYYQGRLGETEILEGKAQAELLDMEASFLSHNGALIGRLLREDSLRAAGIDDGVLFNAMELTKDDRKKIFVRGYVSYSKDIMGRALGELNWRKS